jgi:hypothetical protein
MGALEEPARIMQWWMASAMGAGLGSWPSTRFLPVGSSYVHRIGSGTAPFRASGTGVTPSPCMGRIMKLCCFLAFSGTGRQKTWSMSLHAMANSTWPAALMARMPPSVVSTSSSVNFLR